VFLEAKGFCGQKYLGNTGFDIKLKLKKKSKQGDDCKA
jgi:hypothetical protein